MPKYQVWFEVHDEYVVTIEADSFEEASDYIYENPQGFYEDQSFLSQEVDIKHWEEV